MKISTKSAPWLCSALLLAGASRPADIAFRTHMIDPGFSETLAVADLNNDGKPDLVSSEFWYEAPNWAKHPLREIEFASNYVDNFSDLTLDVDGDGYIDIVQFGYFSKRIVWLKNPGPKNTAKTGGKWEEHEIDSSGPTEFAFLVDLNNDGKALELLPEIDRKDVPMAWFELKGGKFVKHVVAKGGYGHGIGVGDVNGDGRNDILTPMGWLEAPADLNSTAEWTFHATDWAAPATPGGKPAQYGFMYVLDINGDGRPDILTTAAHDYGVFWFEQKADGGWTKRVIDNTWSQSHASTLVDLNGDGKLDLVTGKRYMAHNGNDPGEREPVGLYWYEYRKDSRGAVAGGGVEWIRHIVDYGGRMGGGMQVVVKDLDGDGDLDIVSGGKAGLFWAENLTKTPRR